MFSVNLDFFIITILKLIICSQLSNGRLSGELKGSSEVLYGNSFCHDYAFGVLKCSFFITFEEWKSEYSEEIRVGKDNIFLFKLNIST